MLANQALLVLATGLVASGSMRAASLAAPRGAERAIAAAVIAGAWVVASMLCLAVVDLGGSTLAVVAATVLFWVASRALPRPELALRTEVADFLRGTGPARAGAAGGAVGLAGGLVAYHLHHPIWHVDSVYYHVPRAVSWVQTGRPGASIQLHALWPVESYPGAHEVLLTWLLTLSRSFVPLSALGVGFVVLLGVSLWSTMSRLGARPAVAVLGALGVCTIPIVFGQQLDGAANDLPGLAWLAAAAALLAGVRRRPRLVPLAILAAALAAGTKPTFLPFAAAIALAACLAVRRERAMARATVAALAVASLVAGYWYAVAAVRHGSPFWPFVVAPWGDPKPDVIATFHSVLASPREIVRDHGDGYLMRLAGGFALLAGCFACAWLGPRRARVGAAVVLLSLVLWAISPTSGLSDIRVLSAPVSQTRYLFGAIALAALVVALASTAGGLAYRLALFTFGAALAANLVQNVVVDHPDVLPPVAIAAGLACGGIAAYARRAGHAVGPRALALAGALTALAAVVVADRGARGYTDRLTAHSHNFDRELVEWLRDQPRFRRAEDPVAMGPEVTASVVGDSLEHELRFLAPDASCATVAEQRRRGWVVVRDDAVVCGLVGQTTGECLRGQRYATAGMYRVYAPQVAAAGRVTLRR